MDQLLKQGFLPLNTPVEKIGKEKYRRFTTSDFWVLLTWLDLLCLLFLLYADAAKFCSHLLHHGMHSVSVSGWLYSTNIQSWSHLLLQMRTCIFTTPLITFLPYLEKKKQVLSPERFLDTEHDPCALECAVLRCFVIRSLLQSSKRIPSLLLLSLFYILLLYQ